MTDKRNVFAALLLAAGAGVLAACAARAATRPSLRVTGLTTEYRTNPLGLEEVTPRFGWVLESTRRGERQTAYRILVASRPERLVPGKADVWDSGTVRSGESVQVPYAGKPLRSARRYYWTVRAWGTDGRPSAWSAPAWWEMALLSPSDWTARWIAEPDALGLPHKAYTFPARTARYLRLTVTRLGEALPLDVEHSQTLRPRLQLAEVEAYGAGQPGVNLALGGKVTASDDFRHQQQWMAEYLTDGIRSAANPHSGYSSGNRPGEDVSAEPLTLEIDLGRDVRLDRVALYPRTDYASHTGGVPNFPKDFAIETRAEGEAGFTEARRVVGEVPPPLPEAHALPLFAKDFALEKPIAGARLYVTGLGRYEARLNGRPVEDALLTPGDTDYRKRVEYAVVDVTRLLRRGANTLGIALAGGQYHLQRAGANRYSHHTSDYGPLKARAQLTVRFVDGTSRTLATDGTWLTAPGPLLASNWYGGEDYDARREVPGWDLPGANRSAWKPVAVLPEDSARLTARRQPPIRIVQALKTARVTEPKPGIFVFDLGQNFAGWPEINLSGPAGTTVTMHPAEVLHPDGTVDQSTALQWGAIYDTYTLKGTGQETWRPKFMYHGFRYLQVTGWPGIPGPGNARGLVLRAANPRVGSFACANPLVNGIHRLIDWSVMSNMMSVLTDCPHREKLGWLEVSQLMFPSITDNYASEPWYAKIEDDTRDAQLENGMVPDIAPEYQVFDAGFRDDPNWGGATVFNPWFMYERYGDVRILARHFDGMRRYVDYLTGASAKHIVSHGLGDWFDVDGRTPVALVSTATYYQQLRILARAADLLGKKDIAARYKRMAGETRDAYNAAFFHPDSETYAAGSQAALALSLANGLVPAGHERAVARKLADDVRARGYHVTVGEVSLPSLLRALDRAGYGDVIWNFATQTEHASYGYQVVNGATSLTEAWDGPKAARPDASGPIYSQNHCMLGHIEEWFYEGLCGLRPAAPGWAKIDVRPTVPEGLAWAAARTDTVRGRAASSWRREKDGSLRLTVTIPANAAATVFVPAASREAVTEGGRPADRAEGVRFLRMDGDRAVYAIGSGTYTFRAAR